MTTIEIIDIVISIIRSMAEATLRQVRMFLAVARCGSFRQAADDVAASQSSLSIQIKELEARVGAALFDRTTRTVRLTTVGAQLLADFERLADAADELRIRSAQITAGHTGSLRIAALPSIADEILPEVIARFQHRLPKVRIHIREAIEEELIAAVKTGQCDLGLTSARMLEHGMTFESLYRDELVAVMKQPHRLASHKRIAVTALTREALILTQRTTSLRQAIDRAFADAGASVIPAYEVGHMVTALSFAARGLGIALLPAGMVRGMRRKDVAISVLADQAGSRSMGVLQLQTGATQPLQRRFVELLRSVVIDVVPRRLRLVET